MKQTSVKPDMVLALILLSSDPMKTLEEERRSEIKKLSLTHNYPSCWQYLCDAATGKANPLESYSDSKEELDALKAFQSLISRYNSYKKVISVHPEERHTSIYSLFELRTDADAFLKTVEHLSDADFCREIQKAVENGQLKKCQQKELYDALSQVFSDVPNVNLIGKALRSDMPQSGFRKARKEVTRHRI